MKREKFPSSKSLHWLVIYIIITWRKPGLCFFLISARLCGLRLLAVSPHFLGCPSFLLPIDQAVLGTLWVRWWRKPYNKYCTPFDLNPRNLDFGSSPPSFSICFWLPCLALWLKSRLVEWIQTISMNNSRPGSWDSQIHRFPRLSSSLDSDSYHPPSFLLPSGKKGWLKIKQTHSFSRWVGLGRCLQTHTRLGVGFTFEPLSPMGEPPSHCSTEELFDTSPLRTCEQHSL